MMASSLLVLAVIVVIVATVPYHYPKERGKFDEAAVSRLSAGKSIVVTGANSGLGRATVEHLYRADPENAGIVIMGCRSMERCNKAKEEIIRGSPPSDVRLVPAILDLASRESIDAFATQVNRILSSDKTEQEDENDVSVQPLNVLINNAGIMGAHGSAVHTYHGGVESHIAVNHLGHFYLTHRLWPNLIAGRARVTMLTSVFSLVNTKSTDGWYENDAFQTFSRSLSEVLDGLKYYARSKRAAMQFASELHRRYHNDMYGISATAAHPGCTRTNIQDNGWRWSFLPTWFTEWFKAHTILCMSAEVGSMIQLRAAIDTENIVSGSLVAPYGWAIGQPAATTESMATNATFVEKLTAFTRHYWPYTYDDTRELWEQSLKAVGIEEFGKDA